MSSVPQFNINDIEEFTPMDLTIYKQLYLHELRKKQQAASGSK